MPNTHTITLGELREYYDGAEAEYPQWMRDMYDYYGPELWVEVQEDNPLEQPKIVQ